MQLKTAGKCKLRSAEKMIKLNGIINGDWHYSKAQKITKLENAVNGNWHCIQAGGNNKIKNSTITVSVANLKTKIKI